MSMHEYHEQWIMWRQFTWRDALFPYLRGYRWRRGRYIGGYQYQTAKQRAHDALEKTFAPGSVDQGAQQAPSVSNAAGAR